MKLKKALGMRIRIFRKRRGLTQEELADLVGRSPVTVRKWERGGCFPGAESFKSLSQALKVPLRDFFDFPQDRLESMSMLIEAAKSLDDERLKLATTIVNALALNSDK